jgi:hypothetical protein
VAAATAAAVPVTKPVAAHGNIKPVAAAAVAAVVVAAVKANSAQPKAAGTVSALAAEVAAPAAVVAVVKPSDFRRQNHGGLHGPPFLGRSPVPENFRGNSPPNLTTFAHALLFIFSPVHFSAHWLPMRHTVAARAAREISARGSRVCGKILARGKKN